MARVRLLGSSGLADRLRRKADITHELAVDAFYRGRTIRGFRLLRQFKREDAAAKAALDHQRRVEFEHVKTARALASLLDRVAERQAGEREA